MKTVFYQISLGLVLAFSLSAAAQTYDTNNVSVGTFAGSGFAGFYDGNGTQTMFNSPSSIVADSLGNLFVLDSLNYRIRKIAPDATVSTFVGGGTSTLPSSGTNISLSAYSIGSMAIDHSNVLWLADEYYGALIRIGADGFASDVTNVVWSALPFGAGSFSVDGSCVDSSNNLYLTVNSYSYPYGALNNSQIVCYRTDGTFKIFAGYGVGATDGNGLLASFSKPGCMTTDAADNVYVWDGNHHLIRRIDQNQNVVTLTGTSYNGSDFDGFVTSASFNTVGAMCADDYANIFLACGDSIRKLSASTNVVTMAGSFTQAAYTNGVGSLARFSGASGICLLSNRLFVADSANQRIRQINFTQPPPATGPSLGLDILPGLQIMGLVGRQYQIESSVNAATWNVEATLTLSSSPFLWLDQNSGGPRKTYRAWLLP